MSQKNLSSADLMKKEGRPHHYCAGISWQNKSQLQAYVNEYKGTLFEYLVAQELAQKNSCLEVFYQDLSPKHQERLLFYEGQVRQVQPELPMLLNRWGKQTAQEIQRKFIESGKMSVKKVQVLGKALLDDHDAVKLKSGHHSEADILLQGEDFYLPLSLKLTKAHAFVNTKSGGLLSFIKKYFRHQDKAWEWQEIMATELAMSWQQMACDLYRYLDLPLGHQETRSFFGEEWDALGLSHLPGQLPKDLNAFVLAHYARCAHTLYQAFVRLKETSPLQFALGLLPLCGHTHQGLVQVLVAYDNQDQAQVQIEDFKEQISSLEENIIRPYKEGLSSFEIELPTKLLQIRIKPMNTFTVMAPKVNCSIKALS